MTIIPPPPIETLQNTSIHPSPSSASVTLASSKPNMSSNDGAPIPDPYSHLGLIPNPDGSVTRIPNFYPTTAASSDPANPVLTKDVPINPKTNTWARIYLPRPEPGAAAAKLPLVVFFHGGGFVILSAASTMFQKFCGDVVRRMPAVMVSVDYRNAPEHRLPAAYDDCFEALQWIKTADEEWLREYADLSRCFLMGQSAGGNIVYHVALRAAAAVDQLGPLKIRGLVLQDPFFGGVERTQSEIRLANDKVFPLCVSDLIWELALPVEVDRNHEYSSPIKAPRLELLEEVKKAGWRVLVTGYRGDLLVDRLTEFVKMLRERDVNVVAKITDGGFHGAAITCDSFANSFYDVLRDFVLGSST